MIGKTLVHYEITALIGKGGMGEVYRARDTKLGRDVALKLLPSDLSAVPARLERFEREAKTVAALNHPHIVTLHSVEEDQGFHFLTMELVEGQSLDEMLSNERLSLTRILDIAAAVADALAAAHERGIVHRDLKPANVMVTRDGRVKVLDFGLARAFETPSRNEDDLIHSPTITADHTMAGTILGTVAYMSPEQVRGQAIDARSDIWSFGCLLYEMLCGEAASGGSTTQDTLAAILEREPDWEALPPETPARLRRLLELCLRKDPSHRLHAMADARIELEDMPTEPVPSPSPIPKQPRRSAMVLGAVAFFVLGAAVVHLISPPQEPPQSVRPGMPARYSLATATPIVPVPEASSVAVAPNGEFIVYVALGSNEPRKGLLDQVSQTKLFVRSVNEFDTMAIEGTTGASSPFVSPDGRWIGYYDTNELSLKKVARAGGAPVLLAEGNFTGLRGAHWTADGKIYFGGGGALGLYVVDEDGGGATALTIPDRQSGEKSHRFPHVLPDDRNIVFTLAPNDIESYDDAGIALYSLDSGDIRILLEGGTNPRYVPSGHVVFGRAGQLLAIPFDVETLSVSGTPREVLAGVVTSDGYGSAHYAVSNDGMLVYVPGGPEYYYSRIHALDVDGNIDTYPISAGTWGDVAISPEGDRLALSELGASANLWLYEIDRLIMNRLTRAWDNYGPTWHPDGRHIAFATNRGGDRSIYQMAVDGSGQPTRLLSHAYQAFPGSWHPDGRRLSYAVEFAGRGADVRIFDTVSQEDQSAVETPAREYYVSISPDGKHLAYVSDESGQPEVYVQTLPITGRRWRLSEAGGDSPRWAPDGESIYFWSRRDLMVVPVENEPVFKPGRAQFVLTSEIEDVKSYDVFPDGRTFAVIGRLDVGEHRSPVLAAGGHRRRFASRVPDIRVVLNWFEELP